MLLKKFICVILSVNILFLFAGCTSDLKKTNQNQDTVNLIYYTIGQPDKDLKLVETEINNILQEKYNFTISYNKIGWADYANQMAALVNSGSYFDIAFSTGIQPEGYIGYAKKGAWLPLQQYLKGDYKKLYNTIDPILWEGVTYNDEIYGIPTNKELAVPLHFMYPQELVTKYNIDVTKYKTLQSLEPLLKMIKFNEPSYVPFELNNAAYNFFAIDGYEYIINNKIPLMVKSTDKELKVVNIFETEEGLSVLKTLRNYYENGYINVDAPVNENLSLVAGDKVFLRIAEGGPYSDSIWSTDRQYKIVSETVTDSIVTSESTQGGVMSISANTNHPQECMQFLNELNTNADLRNLINFGIENTHYSLTENGQVNKISNDYSGVQYTQGNWFILKTVVGEPIDKWNEFKRFNNNAHKSESLGFNADISSFSSLAQNVQNVNEQYYSYLMTGSVDTDKFLPMYLSKLKAAGIDEIKTEVQKQINIWLENKKIKLSNME